MALNVLWGLGSVLALTLRCNDINVTASVDASQCPQQVSIVHVKKRLELTHSGTASALASDYWHRRRHRSHRLFDASRISVGSEYESQV